MPAPELPSSKPPSSTANAMPGFLWQAREEKAPRDINLEVSTDNILKGGRRHKALLAARPEVRFIPKTYDEAMSCPDRDKWKASMDDQVNSLLENQTWEGPVNLPEGRKAVGGRWVFAIKTDASGIILKYKSRWVVKGFTQVEGIDYEDVFAPVARAATLRVVLAIAIALGLVVTQMDVVTADLYSELDKEIYIKGPEGYDFGTTGMKALRLLKGLYGLKQSGKLWNEELKKTLGLEGFFQSINDPGLFIYKKGNVIALLIVYVDDLVLATNSPEKRKSLETTLKKFYKMKLMGKIETILGINVKIDEKEGILTMNQGFYLNSKVAQFRQEGAKAVQIPMDPGTALQKSDEPKDTTHPYQEAIGSILYAAGTCRPDISFAVGYLGRFSSCHQTAHWNAVINLIRYLKETASMELVYRKPKD